MQNISQQFSISCAVQTTGTANTLTMTNQSGAAFPGYALQIGRAFLPGASPAGQSPQLTVNSTPTPTQVDVKNVWPDGSLKFAVLATHVDLPASGSLSLAFTSTSAAINVPMTLAQMIAVYPDFEVQLAISPVPIPAHMDTGVWPTASRVFSAWAPITNGGFTLQIDGAPVVVSLNFSILATDFSNFNSSIAAAISTASGFAGATFVGINNTWQARVSIPGHNVGLGSAPPAGITDVSAMLAMAIAQGATVHAAVSGSPVVTSALAMMQAGHYKLWTAGPIAQTIEVSDDSGSFDISTDGTNHPLRPRFYCTFWPAGLVDVRVVVENNKTTQLMDCAYTAQISIGNASPTVVYSVDLTGTQATHPKLHWVMTSWTKQFQLGAARPLQVNINHNAPYLTSTHFLPNWDTTISIPESAIASYDTLFTTRPNDIYDGVWTGGVWQNSMANVGGRMDIGPEVAWAIVWLYTGDWRMRRMSVGLADIASAVPTHLRESATGKRLSRDDAVGASTGFGLPISVTDHKNICTFRTDLLYAAVPPIGPVNTGPPWTFNNAHEPSAHYIPYLCLGDPWYMQEMLMWASFEVATAAGGTGSNSCRGPTGAEGGYYGEVRALGWGGRALAQTAFICPDADPMKSYFLRMMNDRLGELAGVIGITGTAFQTAPPITGSTLNEWQWAQLPAIGNHQASAGAAYPNVDKKVGPIGQFQSNAGALYDNPATQGLSYNAFGHPPNTQTVAFSTALYMHNYCAYFFHRATELGFAAGPIFSWFYQLVRGLTLDSGIPFVNCMIEIPTVGMDGNWFPDFPTLVATLNPTYISGVGWTGVQQGTGPALTDYWNSQAYSESYRATAGCIAAMGINEARGDQVWAWHLANNTGTTGAGAMTPDPRWAIVPRMDGMTLPSIPVSP